MKVSSVVVGNLNETLTVHVEEKECQKGYVSYFINGEQVVHWGTLTDLQKALFTALADDLCAKMFVSKWSY